MPQTSVALRPGIGYAGQITDAGAPRFCRSANVEGSGVLRGFPLQRGTDTARQVKAFGDSDTITLQNFAGIMILETSRALPSDEDASPQDGDKCTIVRVGVIYMDFGAAVEAGQDVAYKPSTADMEGVDRRGTPTSGYKIVPGLKIAETTTEAGLAAVEVCLLGADDKADDSVGALITDDASLRTQLTALIADVTAIRTKFVATLAKLDADAGVTDTNYAALETPAAMTAVNPNAATAT